jgi:hypothetical protein
MSKRKEPEAKKETAYLFIVSCSICGKDESTLIYKHHLHEDSLLLLSEYPWESETSESCTPELLELLYHLGHECVVRMEHDTQILSKRFEFHEFATERETYTNSSDTTFDISKVGRLKLRHIHLKCDDSDVLREEAKFCLKLNAEQKN